MNARRTFRLGRTGVLEGWRQAGRTSVTGSMPVPRWRADERRRLAALPLFVVVAVASAVGVVYAVKALKSGDVMPVRSVAVRGVADERGREVRAYADVRLGAPLFGVDLDEVAARVREHPFVRAVTVRRVPPDGIEIEVTERTPSALVAAGTLYLVDDTGAAFKRARPGDGLDLPVVTGLEASDFEGGAPPLLATALEAIRAYQESARPAGELSEAHVDAGRGVTLVFAGGLRVAVGEGDFASRLTRLERVLGELKTRELQASFIYLKDERRPERVAVRLRASSEMTAHPGT